MNWDMIWNGGVCILAMIMAFFHSRIAFFGTIAIFIGFLFYCSAWAPDGFSPRDIVFALSGEKIPSAVFWALGDTVVMLIIAGIAIDRFWGMMVALLFMFQICLHILKIYHYIDRGFYQFFLDRIFNIQMLIFLLIGYGPTSLAITRFRTHIATWLHRKGKSMRYPIFKLTV